MSLFVLQNNSFDRIGPLVGRCLDYCRASGMPFEDRSLTADLDVDGWLLDESEGLVFFGSVGWMKRFKASRYARWVHYDEEAFAASVWVPVLGDLAFNGKGRGWLGDVSSVAKRLEKVGTRLHVRPDRDDKAFSGGLFDAEGWRRTIAERSALLGRDISDLACWVSEPRDISAEIRCWVVDGRVVEASYYRRSGKSDIQRVADAGTMSLMSDFAKAYLPCGTTVMDIAFDGADAGVLEYNPIHSSGWYAADVAAVLDAWTSSAAEEAVRVNPAGK